MRGVETSHPDTEYTDMETHSTTLGNCIQPDKTVNTQNSTSAVYLTSRGVWEKAEPDMHRMIIYLTSSFCISPLLEVILIEEGHS